MYFYTIYKTVNLIDGKIYIGKHKAKNPNGDYLGSGFMIKRAINKYGKVNFEKTVLYIFNNEEEMNLKEIEIVNEDFILQKNTYNIALGGQGGNLLIEYKHSDETKDKIRRSMLGSKKNLSNEQRKIMAEKTVLLHTGSKRSLKTKEKMKISQTNKIKSDITKRKISESVKNILPTYICNVCNKEGKGNLMKLYHFENCKYRNL